MPEAAVTLVVYQLGLSRVCRDRCGARPQVDALVDHFTSFTNDPRQMPVVWHQSLLVFLQVRTSNHAAHMCYSSCHCRAYSVHPISL
jgi:Bystin